MTKITRLKKYPGYSICSDGKVISHWKKIGLSPKGTKSFIDYSCAKEMKFCKSRNAKYLQVGLITKNKKQVRINVHQLICRAFHGAPPSKKCVVRHLDGNPRNNSAKNLSWGTYSDNEQDKLRHGSRGFGLKSTNPVFSNKDEISEVFKLSRSGLGPSLIAKMFNCHRDTIRNTLNKKFYQDVFKRDI